MRAPGQPDAFVVVNGPEDGSEHAIVRAPFQIGSDDSCSVTIRLDKGVEPRHALITSVAKGYRVRRLTAAPVYVEAKRTGMMRSRIVRDGGTIQIGHTLLTLDCAPDGLAYRCQGMVSESDLAWVAERAASGGFRLIRRALNLLVSLFGRIITSWVAVVAVCVVLYLTVNPFYYGVNSVFSWVFYQLQRVVQLIMNG